MSGGRHGEAAYPSRSSAATVRRAGGRGIRPRLARPAPRVKTADSRARARRRRAASRRAAGAPSLHADVICLGRRDRQRRAAAASRPSASSDPEHASTVASGAGRRGDARRARASASARAPTPRHDGDDEARRDEGPREHAARPSWPSGRRVRSLIGPPSSDGPTTRGRALGGAARRRRRHREQQRDAEGDQLADRDPARERRDRMHAARAASGR